MDSKVRYQRISFSNKWHVTIIDNMNFISQNKNSTLSTTFIGEIQYKEIMLSIQDNHVIGLRN